MAWGVDPGTRSIVGDLIYEEIRDLNAAAQRAETVIPAFLRGSNAPKDL